MDEKNIIDNAENAAKGLQVAEEIIDGLVAEANESKAFAAEMTDVLEQLDSKSRKALERQMEKQLRKTQSRENFHNGINKAKQMFENAKQDAKDEITNVGNKIATGVKETATDVADTLTGMGTAAKEVFQETGELIGEAKDAVVNGVKNTADKTVKAVMPLIELHNTKMSLQEAWDRVDALSNELKAKVAQAESLGLNPDDSKIINELRAEISESTKDALLMYADVAKMEATIKATIDATKESAFNSINDSFNSVKNSLASKVVSGLSALENMKNEVVQSINKAKTMGKTAFVGLTEKCASIHRGWLAHNYEQNRNIANNMQKIYDTIELSHKVKNTFIANIKNAFGQAKAQMEGKEFTSEDAKAVKSNILPKLESMINAHNDKAEKCAQEFSESRLNSMKTIMKTKNLRKEFGLPAKASLENNLQAAKEASVQQPKAPVQQQKRNDMAK